MSLIVRLYKNAPKPVVLKCIREDGTETWSKLQPNTAYHDLAHIVIEQTLNLKESFFGMIAEGYNISDFELSDTEKSEALKGEFISKESLVTEHMVNLLTIDFFNNGVPFDYLQTLGDILSKKKLPFPENLNETSLSNIKEAYKQLIRDWKQLTVGQFFETKMIF